MEHMKMKKMRIVFLSVLCLLIFGACRINGGGSTNRPSGSSAVNGGILADSGTGYSFMSYEGPLFPLTLKDSNSAITAERNTVFDFTDSQNHITDSYLLKNTSDSAQKVVFLYPFTASLSSRISERPAITINGSAADAQMHIGPFSGAFSEIPGSDGGGPALNISQITSWEGYKDLTEAGYMASAFDAFPDLQQNVVVYEVKDMYGERSEKAPAPYINIEFNIDFSKTTVLSYGFSGCSLDEDTGYCSKGAFIPEGEAAAYSKSKYLIILGDDISDYKLGTYTNGGCDKALDGAGASVVRYECTLEEIFSEACRLYLNYRNAFSGDDTETISGEIPESVFAGLAAEVLCEYGALSKNPVARYMSLEDLDWIFTDTLSMKRIIYLEFEAEIPAQETVTISAQMLKPASFDYTGDTRNRRGYDMVTKLGSNISFSAQTAEIMNCESVEITEQDFGFDPEKGITSVSLDMDKPHNYIVVRLK